MKRLKEKTLQFNIELSDLQIEQFQTYYEMLIETNKVMNLTAITELDEVITKHFVDSLALAQVYPEICDDSKTIKVLDLGTGAGFPGIPLKIAFPHLNITLMDSLNKRIKYLEDVIDKLELKNINYIDNHIIEIISSTNENGNDICRLDSKKIELPIYIRNKIDGDYIEQLGLNGRKKLKEIFIENKIPTTEGISF